MKDGIGEKNKRSQVVFLIRFFSVQEEEKYFCNDKGCEKKVLKV